MQNSNSRLTLDSGKPQPVTKAERSRPAGFDPRELAQAKAQENSLRKNYNLLSSARV